MVALLSLFVVRPGANHLKGRIVRSIGSALGRRVEVASVSLRLLPWPGFELENFVVHDDPSFSEEPLLRAPEVTASLRIISLLRGRLEVARLSLTEPSLNLTRNASGHWNVEELLQHSASTPIAPTTRHKTELRVAFPYIQADKARINFKFEAEKKPYALTDAEFGLWQDSENEWGIRLKAQPVRTDFNLTDTGMIRVSGTWQRASNLAETPLEFRADWSDAQLGQASKLAYGSDQGWRGAIVFGATLKGKPSDLQLDSNIKVQDFRRSDVNAMGSVRLAARCGGHYSSTNHSLTEIECSAPVGSGLISLDGSIASLTGSPSYDLRLTTQDLPLQSILALLRHAKGNVPEDLAVTGTLEGRAVAQGRYGAIHWSGGGSTTNFQLGSKSGGTEFTLGRIPFAIVADRNVAHPQSFSNTRIDFGPFNVALGRPIPAQVHGSVSRTEYEVAMQGDAQLQSILKIARAVGVSAPRTAAEGGVNFDLRLASSWGETARPVGKAQLHAVRAKVQGLNMPLEIASASLVLKPDQVEVRNLTASLAGSTWRGSMLMPRHCSEADTCFTTFALHAAQAGADKLNQTFNPHLAQRPWYGFLGSGSRSSVPYLLAVNAKGKVTIDRFAYRDHVSTQVSANVDWSHGKLHLSDLRGQVLGGTHVGDWKADFSVQPPEYSGSGNLEQVDLGQIAGFAHDEWITGTASGSYRIVLAGASPADLLTSANATLQLDVLNGSLPHVELSTTSGPLEMQHFAGSISFRNQKFEIEAGKMDTPNGSYQVSGTASMNRVVDMKLSGNGIPGFNITGTLNEPHVSPASASETQASLKP